MVDDQLSTPPDPQSAQAPSLSSSPAVVPDDQSAKSEENQPISTDSTISASDALPSDQSANADTNRPDSPKMADSESVQSQPASEPSEPNRPESSLSTDLSAETSVKEEASAKEGNLADSIAIDSVEPQPQVSPTIVADQPSEPTVTTENPSQNPLETPPPQPPVSNSDTLSNPSDLPDIPVVEEVKSDDVDISMEPNQVPQVQSEVPDVASSNSSDQSQNQSASFKPKPLERLQQVPMADLPADLSAVASAQEEAKAKGDSDSEIPPSPQNPVSFGDIIKDIEITPPNIPEANKPVEQQQPAPHSQPQPQSTSQVIEKIVEKPVEVIKEVIKEIPVEVVKEVPVVDQEEVERQTSQKLRDEQTTRRVLANQTRAKKKQNNINKILELVRTKRRINNQGVRDLLHVSQSSATNYLSELVSRGMLKIEKHAKATFYTI